MIEISNGKVVSIDYTLTDGQGHVIDSSEGGDPLTYLHGAGQLIRGLEKELDGKTAGATFQAKIDPADAYGVRDNAKVNVVSRQAIQGVGEVKVGLQLQAGNDHGHHQVVTITKLEGDDVTIDANHPLAGATLHFDVTVREVREATEEELDHGHVHGPGGHHH